MAAGKKRGAPLRLTLIIPSGREPVAEHCRLIGEGHLVEGQVIGWMCTSQRPASDMRL